MQSIKTGDFDFFSLGFEALLQAVLALLSFPCFIEGFSVEAWVLLVNTDSDGFSDRWSLLLILALLCFAPFIESRPLETSELLVNSDSVGVFDCTWPWLVLALILALESAFAWAVELAEGELGEDSLGDFVRFEILVEVLRVLSPGFYRLVKLSHIPVGCHLSVGFWLYSSPLKQIETI